MRDADHPRLHRAEHRALNELERRAAEEKPPAAAPPGDPGAGPAEVPEAPSTPLAHNDDDMGEGGDEVMGLVPAKVAELYSPPRVTATLPRLGLVAGSTFDLHAGEAATGPEARVGAHPR